MKVSVITVAYNSAATIADTLRSVAGQSHTQIEHIVIDGASKDATLNIVRREGGHVARVVSEPDRGIYDAMNKGLRLATGAVVGFLNSDDFYASPDALAKVAKVFDDPSVEACWGDLCYVKQDDATQIVRYWQSSPFAPGRFTRGWCPPHPTFFVRHRVYERLGGFDLGYRMANDIELMVRFIEVHGINTRYLPELLVKMRIGGASNSNWNAILLQNREIWRALKTHGLSPSLPLFIGGKLVSRGRQFVARPAG